MRSDHADGLYLGLDVGTQGTKGILLAGSGGIVARAHRSYGLIEGLAPGAAEQHPDTWIDAVVGVARDLGTQADLARVRGVGVSGQQHGFVPLDQAGSVIRPAKLWCDTATSEEAAELSQALGYPVPTGFTASKILWLKRREPASWRRLRHVLLPHDYVNYRITGEFAMEPGDASGTGLFDSVARAFDPRALAAVDPDLVAWIPPLLSPGSCVGVVDRAGARLLGVAEGTPVSTGGGDNMMSAIGSGAVEPGVTVVSLGTSGTVFAHQDAPPFGGTGRDPSGYIASFCGSAGGYLPLLCVMNLTGVTGEVEAAFGLDHHHLTELARAVPAGSGGLLWLPFLMGERVPDLPRATGTLLGMRPGCLQPGVLYRAAIEGTCLNLGWGLEHLRAGGVAFRELRLVGGGSHNPLWAEVLAAVTEVPVRGLEEPESACLGAALQALWAVRRRTEPDLPIGDVVASHVSVADQAVEPGPDTLEYRHLRAEFREQLARLYEVS